MGAKDNYLQAINSDTNYPIAYTDLGLAYAQLGDFTLSVSNLQAAINLETTNKHYWLNLGKAFAMNAQYLDAITAFTNATALDSNYTQAYYNLGWCYDELTDYPLAIANYQHAINLDDNYTKAIVGMAIAKARNGQTNEAVWWCKRAIKITTGVSQASQLNALARQNLRTLRGIDYDFEQADSAQNFRSALSSLERERITAATNGFAQLVLAETNSALAHYMYARALAVDNSTNASTEYQTALDLLPEAIFGSSPVARPMFLDFYADGSTPVTNRLFPATYDVVVKSPPCFAMDLASVTNGVANSKAYDLASTNSLNIAALIYGGGFSNRLVPNQSFRIHLASLLKALELTEFSLLSATESYPFNVDLRSSIGFYGGEGTHFSATLSNASPDVSFVKSFASSTNGDEFFEFNTGSSLPDLESASTFYINWISPYATGSFVLRVATPDLAAMQVSGPPAATSGTSIAVTNTVANIGSGQLDYVSGPDVSVDFWLSSSSAGTTNDVKIGSRIISQSLFAPGYIDTAVTLVSLPGNLVAGTYFVRAVVTYNNAPEFATDNNALAGGAMAVAVGPDLGVMEAGGPATAQTGTSISVTNTVANTGMGKLGYLSSSDVTVGFFLSSIPGGTTNDVSLGIRTINWDSFAVGYTNTDATLVYLPNSIAPGTYYLRTTVSYNNVPEVTTNNNVLVSSAVAISIGPDLAVTEVNVPAAASTGANLPVTNIIANLGAGGLDGYWNGVNAHAWLSTDTVLSTNDIDLGAQFAAYAWQFGPAVAVTNVHGFYVNNSVVPGNYHLILAVEYATPEVTTNNNVLVSGAVAISIGPDLAVTEVSVPAAASTGANLPVTNIIANLGTGGLDGYYYNGVNVHGWLSTDTVLSTNDLDLGAQFAAYVGQFGAGVSVTNVSGFYVNNSVVPGNYHLILAVEYATPEVTTNNNVLVSSAVAISIGPDLAVTQLNVPAAASTGANLPVTNIIANLGTGGLDGYWDWVTVHGWLSTDTVLSTNDLDLGAQFAAYAWQFGPAVAVTNVHGFYVNNSVVPGNYHLILAVEYATPEVTTNNNVLVSSAVAINFGLTLTGQVVPDPGCALSNITYTFNVVNRGPSVAQQVLINDPLPPDFSYVSSQSSQGTSTFSAGAVTWSLGNMASGSVATATLVVRPNMEGIFVNRASISASSSDLSAETTASILTTVLQNPAGPILKIICDKTNVILSWSTGASLFHLEGKTAVASGTLWQVVTNVPVISGDRFYVTNAVDGAGLFYRLSKQFPEVSLAPDWSFETSAVTSGCFVYAPTDAVWTFTGSSGLISPPGNCPVYGFEAPPAPFGSQVAFLQQGPASFSQEITLPAAGIYRLMYYDAGRPNMGGNVTYQILLDSTVVGQGQTITAQPFTLRTCDFAGTAGQHSLTFQNLPNGLGDQTAFFDALMLTLFQEAAFLSLSPGHPPQLAMRGTVGRSYRVDYTSDLTTNTAWTALTNIVLPSSPFPISDPGSPNAPYRFYRAVTR